MVMVSERLTRRWRLSYCHDLTNAAVALAARAIVAAAMWRGGRTPADGASSGHRDCEPASGNTQQPRRIKLSRTRCRRKFMTRVDDAHGGRPSKHGLHFRAPGNGDTCSEKAFSSQRALSAPLGDTSRRKVLRYQQTARNVLNRTGHRNR